MELRQLRYLAALEQERNFTRAAAREHVAQPSLSQQIRRLEDELGVALVERTTRSVKLTDAGAALARRAVRALAEVAAAEAEIAGIRGVETGHLSVGAMHTMGPVDVTLVLALFHERHPGIGLTVREQASDELAEMLRTDQLDLAFLSVTERIESHGLRLVQLVTEELVVIVPPGHRLAGRAGISIAELRDEGFVSFREGARLRELLMSAAGEAGFEPRIMVESNELRRIRRLVARGMGVALLPASEGRDPRVEIVQLKLERPALTRDITLAWRADRRLAPAARAFIAMALETSGTGAPLGPGSRPDSTAGAGPSLLATP